MGFPKITYGANLDLIVDFDQFLRSGSGVNPIESGSFSQSLSGIETHASFFNQDFVNLIFRELTPDIKTQLDDFKAYAQDGSTFTVEFDRDLGVFISFEGQSTNTNDGTAPAVFTRALATDSSYYINNTTGLLTVINTADIPRFPQGKFNDGILLEHGRTNLITHPSIFDNTTSGGAWTNSNMTVTDNTTETKDPAGTNLADKIVITGANGAAVFLTSTVISTDDAVFSIWLKSPNDDVTVSLTITDDLLNLLANNNVTVTPQWQKFTVQFNNSGTDPDDWRVLFLNNNTDTFYAYGAELNVGANILYSTSTIGAASTSSVTRAADRLEYSNTDIVGKDKGTIMFWFKPSFAHDEHSGGMLIMIDDAGASRFFSYFITTAGNHEVRIFDTLDNIAASIAGTASEFTQGVFSHVAITYDSTVANSLNLYIDGTLTGGSPSSNTAFSTQELGANFAVGGFIGGSAQVASGVYSEFTILKNVLNATQVKRVADSIDGTSFGKNRITCRLADKNFPITYRNGGLYDATIPCKEVLS